MAVGANRDSSLSAHEGLREARPAGEVERLPDRTEVEVDGHRLRLTSLRKLLYPETGFTTADALSYYAQIAPTLLPHLRGRAMTLKRYPSGVAGPHFYDKHCRGAPPWMQTAPMWSERKGAQINFCRLEDAASLLWSVNYGNLEMHPLLSITPDFDTPTGVVFDLDPGEGATLLHATEIALVLRELLQGVGLQSLAKSACSKGVHVPRPAQHARELRADQALRAQRRRRDGLPHGRPRRRSHRQARASRQGARRLGQNDRHKSTVAPYSLRAKHAGPTVALPLPSDELIRAVDTGNPQPLLPTPHDTLDRVSDTGDRFAGPEPQAAPADCLTPAGYGTSTLG
jgi:bifunctional non-homologous end joining protein LigD